MTEEARMTTVQVDQETSRMLGDIAKSYERSKAAQLRVLVKREYQELAKYKLLVPAEVMEEDEAA